MELNFHDMSDKRVNEIKRAMLTVCQDYEPWADMMHLSGAGDLGVYDFPLNLEEIERIDITPGRT